MAETAPKAHGWQDILAAPEGRPDWNCEVLSPRTARRDRTAKSDLYLRHEVPHYWLVDPEARTLEAYELDAPRWLRLGAWSEDDTASIPPSTPWRSP